MPDRAAQWAERCRVRRVPAANRAQEGAEPRALRGGRREALRRRSSTIQFDGTRRLVEPITTSALDARVRVLASTAPTAGAAAARRRVPGPNPCARAPGLALASPGGGGDGHPLAAAPGLAAGLVSRPVPGRAWAWGRATERQGRRRLQKSIRSTILRVGVVSPTGLIALGI